MRIKSDVDSSIVPTMPIPLDEIQKGLIAAQNYLDNPTPENESVMLACVGKMKAYERAAGLYSQPVGQYKPQFRLFAVLAAALVILFFAYSRLPKPVTEQQLSTPILGTMGAINGAPLATFTLFPTLNPTTDGIVQVRQSPNNSVNTPIIATIPEFKRSYFTGRCSDDKNWGEVQLSDGTIGWVSISGSNCVLDSITVSPAPTVFKTTCTVTTLIQQITSTYQIVNFVPDGTKYYAVASNAPDFSTNPQSHYLFFYTVNDGTEQWVQWDGAMNGDRIGSTNCILPRPISSPAYILIQNTDWRPNIQSINGVEMVLVPVGCYEMGNDAGGSYFEGSQGIIGVLDGGNQCIDKPFWLDRTEVTQKTFVKLGGVAARTNGFVGDNLPRETLTWFEANQFCEHRGGRLPTESEWEYAARGPSNWYYTWGNGNDNATLKQNMVYNPDNISTFQTQPVGSRPDGASWVGALDMLGNVEEWTSTEYKPYPYNTNDNREIATTDPTNNRSIRGGSYKSDGNHPPRATDRSYLNAGNASPTVGFRCVQDASS